MNYFSKRHITSLNTTVNEKDSAYKLSQHNTQQNHQDKNMNKNKELRTLKTYSVENSDMLYRTKEKPP